MDDNSLRNMCIYDTLEGLRDGLSHFSGQSRVALIYAINVDDEIRIYDPQDLLEGHELKFKELYIDLKNWRIGFSKICQMKGHGYIHREKNLHLTGIISYGARSRSIFYQMLFTEHHPDMCSVGPTERWLEHAAWRLSHDFTNQDALYTGISGYFLREYASHAIRDYLVDEMNIMLGWDTQIRVYPILDALLGISKTREEGAWPRGQLVFVEPNSLDQLNFIARFPYPQRPRLENFKHVRKLLQTVENSSRKLVSDGKNIVGIVKGKLPKFSIISEFKAGHSFLKLNGNPICSFSDGHFYSTNFKANLVQVEEALLESSIPPTSGSLMYKIIQRIVHRAQKNNYGCTLVVDLNESPVKISGQLLENPLDLKEFNYLHLAQALAKVDGALHIGADLKLHGFACLLDGTSIPGEDRARGARFNSALRFSAKHKNLIIVVVSSDRPVSIIQEGLELNAICQWRSISKCMETPPTLQEWLKSKHV